MGSKDAQGATDSRPIRASVFELPTIWSGHSVTSEQSPIPFLIPQESLTGRLRWLATTRPESLAYTFLQDGEDDEVRLTYGELDRRARSIAAHLQSCGMAGERALLLFPPGLDFIAAFYGCLYAGVVAVPAYPPRRNRNMVRIQAIADDADAKVVLSVIDVTNRIGRFVDEAPKLAQLRWIPVDAIDDSLSSDWQEPDIHADMLAALQYTSGSTGVPKGVMPHARQSRPQLCFDHTGI